MKLVLRYLLIWGLFAFIIALSLFGVNLANSRQQLYAEIFTQTQRILESQAQDLMFSTPSKITYADARVEALKQFLEKYDSPLSLYAEKLVKVADENGFDYGLLPAIAMVESGLCKKIPENSFNCWGWGIYGKTVTKFVSYDEAIEVVAKGIKHNYIDQGFKTPKQIMTKYNPTNHNNWLGNVNFFLDKLK